VNLYDEWCELAAVSDADNTFRPAEAVSIPKQYWINQPPEEADELRSSTSLRASTYYRISKTIEAIVETALFRMQRRERPLPVSKPIRFFKVADANTANTAETVATVETAVISTENSPPVSMVTKPVEASPPAKRPTSARTARSKANASSNKTASYAQPVEHPASAGDTDTHATGVTTINDACNDERFQQIFAGSV